MTTDRKGTEASGRFNAIVKEARKELDTAKRRTLYGEAQALINDDGGTIVPMFANYIQGINKKVGLPDVMAGNWDLDGSKAMERWWLKG